MQKLTPCLWFDGKAEEAVKFYGSVFPGFKVVDVMRCGDAGPGPKGSVLAATFELLGQEIIALNGGPHFTFSPAISLFVKCKTQKEVDTYWKKLSAGGKALQCGWLTDKFGVTWQIVPVALGKMMKSKDSEKVKRVTKAMMGMVKLDIAALKRAYDGK